MSRHEYNEAIRDFELMLRELDRLYIEKVKPLETRIRETHEKSQGVKL